MSIRSSDPHLSQDMRELGHRLLDAADRRDQRFGATDPLAKDVFADATIQGATLTVSRRLEGTYDVYVVLPKDHPKPSKGHWVGGPNNHGKWWFSINAPTEAEATVLGLQKLIEVGRPKPTATCSNCGVPIREHPAVEYCGADA